MRRWVVGIVLIVTMMTNHLFSQRVLFVGTIPLRGVIELQELFSLEVAQKDPLTFTQELAGTDIEVASYEFFSNSPDVSYQLRLYPTSDNEVGGLFAFRNIDTQGRSTGSTPIPFKVSVFSRSTENDVVGPDFSPLRKQIGVREGSLYQERGAILVSLPTLGEGYDVSLFSSGMYEALITVEVSTD